MTTQPESPTFEGWPTNTYDWLDELAGNNNKPWFTDNRDTYDQMRAASMKFVENLAQRLGSEGEAKVWRIHKDARFSKGGDPYKTTHDFGVFDGNGWMDGMRIESTGVTVALGSFAWTKEQLVRYREAVVDTRRATELIEALAEAAGTGFQPGDPDLKRPLKDLPEDHPDPDLSRRKGLFLAKTYPKAKWIFKPAAIDRVVKDLQSVPQLRAWTKANVL